MWIIIGAESLKGRLLNAARRFSLCAQTEEPPFYKYVSVERPIVDVAPAELEADRRPLAHRYFGPELGDAYVANTDSEGGLKFSMRPTRWWSVDYTVATEIVTRTEKCAYCLADTVVVTVEQLISQGGDAVALTVLEKAPCTRADCIGSRLSAR